MVNLGLDPDWVWSLKGATRPQADSKNKIDIRIFDKSASVARKVAVRDYNSFDDQPNLILYEGWFDKASGIVKIEKKSDLTAPIRKAA